MPGRLPLGSSRPAGPRPFSTAWLEAPEPAAPSQSRFALPAWFPDSQTLTAMLVVSVSLIVGLLGLVGRIVPAGTAPTVEQPMVEAPTAIAVLEPAEPTREDSPDLVQPAAEAMASGQAAQVVAAPEFGNAPAFGANEAISVVRAPKAGPLLPEYRIVTYYGHPHDANMGIVGEHSMEDLAEMVRAEAANYAAADPSRPVIPAFELIATVAQRVPGDDGTYILDTDRQTLIRYIDFAEAQGMLVVLDIQIGRGTVADEIEKVRDLLMRPNVHLAIDPEFAVKEGETPGEYIGSVTAEDVLYAQQVLAEISATQGIPPKLLIVHQFREDMIAGKDRLAPYPGVQLVIDADGYGVPELKTAVYNFLVRDEPVEFGGVKLFYRQDVPVMSAQEILALVPSPDVIIYQ